MITTLIVIFVVLLALAGIPFYFARKKGDGGGSTSLNIGAYVPDYEYFIPFLLLVFLFAVLWLTDHKLGWFSFMLRDGYVFMAFLLTYLVIVSASIQGKDKAKKAPFYQKAMVFIVIGAVDFALIGGIPTNIFPLWHHEASTQPAAQVAPPPPTTKEILITYDWSEEIRIPSGNNIYYCSEHGAEMMVLYDRAEKANVKSGEVIPCPTFEENVWIGTKMLNERLRFRSPQTTGVRAFVIRS